MKNLPQNKGIVLFDGYCNLCSWSVQFIIRRHKNDYFRFASLQSATGRQIIDRFKIPPNTAESVVLIENGSVYFKSTAALRIAKRLSGLWPLSYGFIIVPKIIRDYIYTIIAKNRFKWFGNRTECYLPKNNEQKLFL
ncbi:MAG: DCC1-like thiol-disulfide oxidoreductase family protein [Bacteroidales bacterium]